MSEEHFIKRSIRYADLTYLGLGMMGRILLMPDVPRRKGHIHLTSVYPLAGHKTIPRIPIPIWRKNAVPSIC